MRERRNRRSSKKVYAKILSVIVSALLIVGVVIPYGAAFAGADETGASAAIEFSENDISVTEEAADISQETDIDLLQNEQGESSDDDPLSVDGVDASEEVSTDKDFDTESGPEEDPEIIPDAEITDEESGDASIPVPEISDTASEDTAAVESAEEDAQIVNMPESVFSDVSPEGVAVTVKAEAGVFPEGTEMVIKDVPKGEAKAIANEGIDEGTEILNAVAVDIIFKDAAGNEIEPAEGKNVDVSITPKETPKGEIEVLHKKDDGSIESIDNTMAGNEVKFTGEQFSVYVVVDTGDTGNTARATVIFKNGSNEIARMYVKNSDTAAEIDQILYDPGAGTVTENQTFLGWYISDSETADYTVDTTPKTIAGVRDYFKDLSITEGMTKYVHAMVFNVYHVSFKNEANVIVRNDLVKYPSSQAVGTEVSYLINEPYTPEDIETTNFEGWNVVSGEANIVNYTGEPYPNNTTIKIKGDVGFHVNTPTGRWMSFVENGSGASFTPPVFYKTGVNTQAPADPSRLGYTFGGWYEDAACTGSAYQFGSPITQRVTLYAKWNPVQKADYTVVVWCQKVTGGVDPATCYDFEEAVVIKDAVTNQPATAVSASGTGNSRVAVIDGTAKSITGFHLDRYDENVIVGPEGNTVVNVYYNRNEITLNFYTWTATGGYEEVDGYMGASGSYYTSSTGGTQVYVYYNWRDGKWYTEKEYTWGGSVYSGTSYDHVYRRSGGSGQRSWNLYSTLKGLYGATFSDLEVQWPNEYEWYENGHGRGGNKSASYPYDQGDVSGTHTTFMDAFLIPSGADTESFYGIETESSPNSYVEFYKQKDDMSGYELAYTVRTHAARGQSVSFSISDKYDGFYADHYRLGSGQNVQLGEKDSHGYYATGIEYTRTTLRIYYNRSVYKLTFMDGSYFDGQTGNRIDETNKGLIKTVENIAYGEDISSYNKGKADYYDPTSDLPANIAYAFGGWYVDKSCTTPYTFDKMPRDGMTVYAKWVKKQYRIFLHPNVDPSETDFEWGAAVQQTSFRVSYGEMISGGETINGTRPGYELVGWYYDSGFSNPFIFDAFALNDSTVTTAYDQTQPTELDKYGIPKSGQETYNKDADENRFWVNRKLELYAKWRYTLEGANGINIKYDANGGTNAPVDGALYLDSAKAVAQAASTAASTSEKFAYWVLQTWDATAGEYTDTETHVFPGDDYTVSKTNAKVEDDPSVVDGKIYTVQLRAEYIPKEALTPTHIYWYKNYDGDTEPVHKDENLKINQAVDIQPALTRDGYIFLGWAKEKTATTPWLAWDGSKYTNSGKTVTQVAADERTPYDNLYGVWTQALSVKIEGKTKTTEYTGSEQSVTGFTVKYRIGNGEYSETAPEGVSVALASGKTAEAKGTAVGGGTNPDGSYPMGLDASSFTVTPGSYAFDAATGIYVTDGWLDITKAKLTINVNGSSTEKVYNGSEQSYEGTVTATSEDSRFNPAKFSYSGSKTATGKDVGDHKTDIVESSCSYNDSNCTITWVIGDPVKLTITPAPLNVTVKGSSTEKIYNGSEQSYEGTVTATSSDTGFDASKFSYNGNKTAKGTNVSEYTTDLAEASCSYSDNNYKVTWTIGDPIKLTIDPAVLTITAKDKTYTYNASAQGPAGTYTSDFDSYVAVTGLQGNDALTSITLSGSQTDADVYPNEIEVSAAAVGTATDNYSITYNKGTLTINPAKLTVTAKDQTYKYNGELQGEGDTIYDDPAVIRDKVDVEGLQGNDTIYYIEIFSQATDAGEYDVEMLKAIIKNGENDIVSYNYDRTYVNGTMTIEKRNVTLISESDSKVYDGTSLTKPGVTVSGDGFVEGEVTDMEASGSITDVGSVANAITYTAGEAFKDSNYEIKKEEGTLTITSAAVTVTANNASKTEGDDDPTLTAAVTGLIGSDTITYTVSREEGETAGTYAITPSGEATQGNYNIKYVAGTFTITPESEPVTPTKYKISYDPAGGALRGSTDIYVEEHEEGETITILEAPVRSGYTFQYWKGSEYQPGDKYVVEGDHTFTAVWEENVEPVPVPDNKDNPTTGDEAGLLIWMVALIAAAILMLGLIATRKTGRNDQR